MKLKNLLYGFLYFIFAISCNERILEPEMVSQTNVLKAAAISTNRYVATTGNDNNAGTLAAPFLTIQKAANVANPGDSVIVRDGVYTTTGTQIASINRSGTAGSPIVFKSDHKFGAVLDGQNNKTTQGLYFSHVAYIIFENFEFRGFQDGAIKISESSDNCTIRGNKIHDIGKNCSDSDSGQEGLYISTCSNIIIEKNIIYNIGRYAPGENGCSPA
ncbi:MAG: hypothetical protein WCL21_13860, partial [Mariniphaga sp.]